jgi:cytochrome P450/nicotinamidase-related amidase
METDFSCYDDQIDEIVSRHLIRLLKYRSGRAELLELMLYITIDLLCQVLYGANLPQDELNILVESLAEFTVPATKHRGKYPGGLDCKEYHSKIAKEISDKAPDGVFVKIITGDEKMSEELRYENCAFFLEALTPAFASFWTLSNIILKGAIDKNMKQECLQNPTFREQCIKESLRMYPPVPALWGRIANETHTFTNPLYDPDVEDERSFFGKIFSEPDIRTLESITIKKDTMVMVIPACLHYDDRIWMNAEEFLPSRWNKDPRIIQENFTTARKARQSTWGALAIGKGDDAIAKLEQEKAAKKMSKGSGYDADAIPMRYKLFGPKYESAVEGENLEHLQVASEVEDLMSYSFFPFGLGKHMCLGRRLAVKMVDGIVANLLSYDINFENGVTPNLFKRHWSDRLNSVSAVYNYPADPVYVEFAECKGNIKRIENMFTKEARNARKSMFQSMVNQAVVASKAGNLPVEEEQDEPKKCAVLFITCQNEFLDPKGKLYSRVEKVMEKVGTKKHLKQLMEAAGQNQALVIHSPVEMEAGVSFGKEKGGFDEWKLADEIGVFAPGSWGREFYADTLVAPGDVVLAGRKDADIIGNTNLLTTLKNNQIDVLFVAGLLTDVTVENTVTQLAKKMKGKIEIHPVSDATAAYTMEAQQKTFDFVLKRCSQPVTTDEAVEILEGNMDEW